VSSCDLSLLQKSKGDSASDDSDNSEPQPWTYQPEIEAHRSKPNTDLAYNVLQMIGFTCMAILIMRLKLFMTPMMSITASLFANRLVVV